MRNTPESSKQEQLGTRATIHLALSSSKQLNDPPPPPTGRNFSDADSDHSAHFPAQILSAWIPDKPDELQLPCLGTACLPYGPLAP